MTNYRDLYTFDEVKTLIMLLTESVAARLRESGLGKAKTVKITVTDNALNVSGKQGILTTPSSSAIDIANEAYKLFNELYDWRLPVRAVGVGVCNFTQGLEQLSIDFDPVKEKKQDSLDLVVDNIRKKYGNNSVQRASILQDKRYAATDVKGEHVIAPGNLIDIKEKS